MKENVPFCRREIRELAIFKQCEIICRDILTKSINFLVDGMKR